MPSSEPVRAIRHLGRMHRIGAIVMAEQAVDTYVDAYSRPEERTRALDALRRDLARLRHQEPMLDRFIVEVERYVDLLDADLARRAA